MSKKTSWHEFTKKALKEIGKEWGYAVSESEKVMVIAKTFSMFRHQITGKGYEILRKGAEERESHVLSYKPDVVWKKGRYYKAIFEVECLDERMSGIKKRKYAIGSMMLAYLAMIEKSAKYLIIISNNESLYRELVKFKHIISLEHEDCIHTYCLTAHNPPNINIGLKELLSKVFIKNY